MKNVYLFGAGASAGSEYNLPTMNNFFDSFSSSDYPNLSQFLEKYFHVSDFSALNLEKVITHIELSLEGFGSKWSAFDFDIHKTRSECVQFIQSRLRYSVLEGRDPSQPFCKLHRALLGHCSSNDTFITLNYDMIMDYSLHGFVSDTFNGSRHLGVLNHIIGTPLFATENQPITLTGEWKGFYLKLHGSLDWFYCPNSICVNHQGFYSNMQGVSNFEVNVGDPCRICGSELVPVIIPPTLGKSFEKFIRMGILWNIAYREISNADKLIFIGVSLPESDYYLRWLLREAVAKIEKNPEVVVVNPDPEAVKAVCELIGVAPEKVVLEKCFSEFVSKMN